MKTIRARRCGWVSRRRGGQVLIITLLAILLLAGMVFYVFNLGDQVNRRVSMQNAADSAAIGGANWMARSMNVIAMNNVGQTRLITMVGVLDSLPLATEMSYEELAEWLRGLDMQLEAGIPDRYLDEGLRSMTKRFHGERRILEPLYRALIGSGYDVRPLTFWRLDGIAGPPPHGKLWVGAKALEDFNRATYETAGLLAQATASRMGAACIVRDPDVSVPQEFGSAFIVPVLPELPARLGTLMDFKKPIEDGRPAEYVEGTVSDHIRRGPYDQLFKWRMAVYDHSRRIPISRAFVPGSAGPMRKVGTHGVGGKVVGSSVVGGPQDHWRTQYKTIHGPQVGWRAYGVYRWAVHGMHRSSGLAHFVGQNLRDTNFLSMLHTLSRTKMNYIWGQGRIKRIHHPKWISPYPEARDLVGNPLPGQGNAPNPQQPLPPGQPPPNAGKVKYTMFYMVQTKSSVDPNSSGYRANSSTYVTNSHDPQAIWLKGWVDPETWQSDPVKTAVKIADYIWRIDWTYETTFDGSIGLQRPPALGPGEKPVWRKVYIREQYVFGGVDIGPDVVIRNPANWQSGDEKPRPYLMALDKADYRTPGERDYLSFLGVARQTNRPSFWPDRFGSGNPYPNVLAVGEAQVFNNQSWDLWTQDWQARLRPINAWDYWVNQRMEASPGDVQTVRRYVDADDLTQVKMVLQSYDPTMVEKLKTH